MYSSNSTSGSCCSHIDEGCMGGGEVEVAKVLASLRRSDSIESGDGEGDGDGDGRWGCKGKRSTNKRGRDQVERAARVAHNSLPLPFDLNMDQAAVYEDEVEDGNQLCTDIKVEGVCESTEPNPIVNHNSGRSRQNLTEAEKEARRIRRILANRESARQTIRRRQALYEDLTKRAANLALENEDLKRSKDLALKDYQSLQNTNNNLKNQMTRILGLELGKTDCESKLANADTHETRHSAKWQPFMYNKFMSSSPFMLTSYIQPSEVDNPPSTQPGFPFSTKVVVASSTFNPCQSSEQGDTGQEMPWCILPCPWFLSVSNTGDCGAHQLPSVRVKHDIEDSLIDARHVISPCSVLPCRRNSSSQLTSNVGGQESILQAKASSSCISGSSFFPLNQADDGTLPNPLAPDPSDVAEQSSAGLGNNKGDAAAAEARKRRRELIKLKSLHYIPLSRRDDG